MASHYLRIDRFFTIVVPTDRYSAEGLLWAADKIFIFVLLLHFP
jgi:hypothetical protein